MDNDFPCMIYRAGGPHEIHGGRFDYIIIEDADELAAALADGWAMTTAEALAALAPAAGTSAGDNAPPTRAELEAKAAELGVEFSPRIGDTKLLERIEAALAAKA